jgi:hypothetical protein
MNRNWTATILAAAAIISALILVNGYKYRFRSAEGISVVGMAQVNFASDLIVWEGKYLRQSKELKVAYAALKEDEATIRSYLRSKGMADSSVIISAVNIQQVFDTKYGTRGEVTSNTFVGYTLSQTVKIESKDIDRVEKLSREVTELIEKGIELSSEAPSYYYTRLADLKMDLLAKASADAKQRANTIAKSVDSKLGNLRKSVMGVFQITGKNSNEEYSYGGSYNTTDKNKTASITIRMEYGVN